MLALRDSDVIPVYSSFTEFSVL